MREEILQAIADGVRAIEGMKEPAVILFIEQAATIIADSFRSGNKLLICGNGGSLCDAMHFAEELSGLYREKRPALPAIALSDPGMMSCIGNDLGYEWVFSRGVEAYGQPGDVLVVLTTSGNSSNLIPAVSVAKERGLSTIAFLGKTGGKLKGQADLEWIVSGFRWSDRIQEAHMTAIHIIIEQIEKLLFAPSSKQRELSQESKSNLLTDCGITAR
ncbi:MAG TPA: SIS domain-containing protein [Chlamydiales bacterium]|jgi:D-sedoheptulose 7-phosphate isomerase|nr:SIS domain-containing protein [Chlamydiales bacterium]